MKRSLRTRGVELGSFLAVFSLVAAMAGGGCGDEPTPQAGAGGAGGDEMTSGTGGSAAPQGGTSLFVEVFDKDTLEPVHKARVRIAERLRLTDDLGHALLDNLIPGKLVLRIDALGYVGALADVSAIRETHAGQRVYLKKRDAAATTLDAKIGGMAVASTGDAEVEIPPDALVGVDGKPVEAKVVVIVTPIDPSMELSALPGTAETISVNAEAPLPLASISMVDVAIEVPLVNGPDELGSPVFLAPGKHAKLKRRIPGAFAGALQNGDVMQAFRLEPSSGVFGADEMGTIEPVPNGPGQLLWSGELSQTGLFSVARRLTAPGCIRVQVNAGGSAQAGVFVQANASDRGSAVRGFTDSNGEVRMRVPSGVPIDVRLPADPAGAVQTLSVATEASAGCQDVVIETDASCGLAGASEPCNGPSVGGCEPRRHCDSLAWGACTNERSPNVEVCNGIDDDCDGKLDEELVDFGFRCDTGKPGICALGFVNGCIKGKTLCKQVGTARPNESCNGLDDDCDGETDEGNPGGGGDCQTGLAGACSSGVWTCARGALLCKAKLAMPEQCNGLDDDCDGDIDEEFPGSNDDCSTGLFGVCEGGTIACVNNAPQCVQAKAAGAETCDNLDNDCDGVVDNGNPGGGAACSTGLSGLCAPGTSYCSGGVVLCLQDVMPVVETCNFLDDDCDGTNDNGLLCCMVPGDCASGVCINNECQAPTCLDGVANDLETDIDCGGGVCAACGVGGVCKMPTDCTSLVCTGLICQAATCTDMVQNQGESDIDCGGVACTGCLAGQTCGISADCAVGPCSGGICQN